MEYAADPEIDRLRLKIEDALAAGNWVRSSRIADVRRRAREMLSAGDGYVRDRPWQAAGIAALAGVVVGILVGRRQGARRASGCVAGEISASRWDAPTRRTAPLASVALLVTTIVFTPRVAVLAASVAPSAVVAAAALLVGSAAPTRIATVRPNATREPDETERQKNMAQGAALTRALGVRTLPRTSIASGR